MDKCDRSKLLTSTRGQLNSEWIYDAIVFPKTPTQNFSDFCPGTLLEGRAEILFWLVFWDKLWPYKFILNLTDLYHFSTTIFLVAKGNDVVVKNSGNSISYALNLAWIMTGTFTHRVFPICKMPFTKEKCPLLTTMKDKYVLYFNYLLLLFCALPKPSLKKGTATAIFWNCRPKLYFFRNKTFCFSRLNAETFSICL